MRHTRNWRAKLARAGIRLPISNITATRQYAIGNTGGVRFRVVLGAPVDRQKVWEITQCFQCCLAAAEPARIAPIFPASSQREPISRQLARGSATLSHKLH